MTYDFQNCRTTRGSRGDFWCVTWTLRLIGGCNTHTDQQGTKVIAVRNPKEPLKSGLIQLIKKPPYLPWKTHLCEVSEAVMFLSTNTQNVLSGQTSANRVPETASSTFQNSNSHVSLKQFLFCDQGKGIQLRTLDFLSIVCPFSCPCNQRKSWRARQGH